MDIIGLKRSKFTPQEGGEEIRGYTLHLTEERDGVEGLAVERAFVSDKKLGDYKPALGDDIRLVYNKWGKVDHVELAAY